MSLTGLETRLGAAEASGPIQMCESLEGMCEADELYFLLAPGSSQSYGIVVKKVVGIVIILAELHWARSSYKVASKTV